MIDRVVLTSGEQLTTLPVWESMSSVYQNSVDVYVVYMSSDLRFCTLFALLLTHCVLVDASTVICWTSPFVILGVSDLFRRFYNIFYSKIL